MLLQDVRTLPVMIRHKPPSFCHLFLIKKDRIMKYRLVFAKYEASHSSTIKFLAHADGEGVSNCTVRLYILKPIGETKRIHVNLGSH